MYFRHLIQQFYSNEIEPYQLVNNAYLYTLLNQLHELFH